MIGRYSMSGTKALVFVFSAAAGLAAADQVTLKNGDRLTGAVLKSDAKALTLKSEFAGTVAIDWNAIETITSAEPLYLTLKSGQVLIGPVETASGIIQVKTADAGTVSTSKAQVDTIRSKQEEEAYQAGIDRLRNPGLLDLWAGFLETGLSLSRGNSDTTTFNLGMNAARATKRDKISVNLTSLYSKNKVNGVNTTSADAVRGGIRYDLNVSERVFGFGFTNLEYDKFQHLDLRAVIGGGFGDHIVKHENTTFDLFGGAALNKEFYTTLTRSSGELLVGEEFMHKVSKSTVINERLSFFPNVSQTGEYRMTFTGSAVTAISKWLGFHLTLSDIYVTNPPPGIRKNDALLSTGLRITFAR
jgi:putative salt-induced outer membrane protein